MIFSLHKIVVSFSRVPCPEVLCVLQPEVVFTNAFSSSLLSMVVQVFAMGAIRWKTLDIAPSAGRKPQAKWAKRIRGLALPRLT